MDPQRSSPPAPSAKGGWAGPVAIAIALTCFGGALLTLRLVSNATTPVDIEPSARAPGTPRLEFARGNRISYLAPVTEADAQKLGAHLVDEMIFGPEGAMEGLDIGLRKEAGAFVMSMVLAREGAWDDPLVIEFWDYQRSAIAEVVFPGAPVRLELRDRSGATRRMFGP